MASQLLLKVFPPLGVEAVVMWLCSKTVLSDMVDHCRVRRAPWCWGTWVAGKCLWCRNSDCVCLPLTSVACIFSSFLFPSPTLADFLLPVMISARMFLGHSRTLFSTRAWALPGLFCAVVLIQPQLGGCLQLNPLISSLFYLLIFDLWSLLQPLLSLVR